MKKEKFTSAQLMIISADASRARSEGKNEFMSFGITFKIKWNDCLKAIVMHEEDELFGIGNVGDQQAVERLRDTNALIMRIHAVLSGEIDKFKVKGILESIEVCVVNNREILKSI